MSDPIKLEKTEHYQRTNCRIPPIGPCVIVTPRGSIQVEEVPGFLTIEVSRSKSPNSVVVMLYDPGSKAGLIVQMTADNALNAGASMIALANRIDGGEVN